MPPIDTISNFSVLTSRRKSLFRRVFGSLLARIRRYEPSDVSEDAMHHHIDISDSVSMAGSAMSMSSEGNPSLESGTPDDMSISSDAVRLGVGDGSEMDELQEHGQSWEEKKAPTILMAEKALFDLADILNPKSTGKQKRSKDNKLNKWTEKHLQEIEAFLRLYTREGSDFRGQWMKASEQASVAMNGNGKRYGHSRGLRTRAQEFILERVIPENPFGSWAKSRLDVDGELAYDIALYLQEKGRYVRAQDIIDFFNDPHSRFKHDIKEIISVGTAQ